MRFAARTWQLPPVQIASGVGQLCLTTGGIPRTAATVADCTNSSGQQWMSTVFHYLVSSSGLCLTAKRPLSGSAVTVAACRNNFDSQLWFPFQGGQLVNLASMRCLADPAAGGPGTGLALQDCYGEAGEVWGMN